MSEEAAFGETTIKASLISCTRGLPVLAIKYILSDIQFMEKCHCLYKQADNLKDKYPALFFSVINYITCKSDTTVAVTYKMRCGNFVFMNGA